MIEKYYEALQKRENLRENLVGLRAQIKDEAAKEQNGKLTGNTELVLVEEIDEKDDTMVTGRLSNNSVVHFKGDASLIGKIVPVVLEESKGFYYLGRLSVNG